MRVVVTGSSGLVGSAVGSHLADRGHVLAGLDVRPGPWTSLIGDIRRVALCRALVTGADALIHTAALHAPHVSIRSEQDFVSVNVEATQALLEAADRADVEWKGAGAHRCGGVAGASSA